MAIANGSEHLRCHFHIRHGRACPGHPRLSYAEAKTWMPGTRPGMTSLWRDRAPMRWPCPWKVGMGANRRHRFSWREMIPTRFALASKATSPFQGEVELPRLV
ncbi:hypothetical protein DXU07_12420 [Bradyrhizobium elkanii]|nr:hypothetical protein [Bradyrhizobium elkanii]NWL70717.1 hypothetical protein [Bradyrhizobium elkanii]QOZ14610.1 hypothetical protein XI02_05815 [Bradyrhizobium sp. CCBAU 21365]RYM28048.1 hypothetical protein EWH13_12140 [Bradyrhizobium elkanii]